MTQKDFKARLADLRSHAKLLSEACERFVREQKLDEVRNIGVRLRVLVGTGRGSGLLFELAAQTGDNFDVMALNQYGVMKITEIEHGTDRVIQEVEKKALFTQVPGRLPIVFLDGPQSFYRRQSLQEWIEVGFLLDWDVPDGKGGATIARFTPQFLINRYAGQEAAHADSSHGTFGGPVESLTMQYTIDGKQVIVPIVYEYLCQIGSVVAKIALDYAAKHNA